MYEVGYKDSLGDFGWSSANIHDVGGYPRADFFWLTGVRPYRQRFTDGNLYVSTLGHDKSIGALFGSIGAFLGSLHQIDSCLGLGNGNLAGLGKGCDLNSSR